MSAGGGGSAGGASASAAAASADGGCSAGCSCASCSGQGVSGNNATSAPAGASELIPDPSQHVQQIQLGGKTLTIGSDGSASAAEVQQVAAQMQRMYAESPSFRATIDSASTDDLTMTLGYRGDNTSWGGGGRVFLNLNSVATSGDAFESLVGHEWGHAAAGLPHGSELEALEERVAREA